MSQINLYCKTQLQTKISLLPHQIDGNIDDNILQNLISKVKGKVTEHGIIMKINYLIDYDYGVVDKTNFSGNIIYNVKYACLLCSAVKDLEFICVIDNIVKGFIIAINGPIIAAVQLNNIDLNKFEINDNIIKHLKSKKIINKKDYIKVSVININNNLGEEGIMTICKLIDLATPSEIARYNDDIAMIYNDNDNENNNEKFI